MAQSMRVCSDCGAEVEDGDHYRSRVDHNWSDADPLARLEARIEASSDLEVKNSENNDDWQWVSVKVENGVAEHLANWVSQEGFSFLGTGGVGSDVVRFNKKK